MLKTITIIYADTPEFEMRVKVLDKYQNYLLIRFKDHHLQWVKIIEHTKHFYAVMTSKQPKYDEKELYEIKKGTWD